MFKRLEILESEKREDTTRIEFLERMKEDTQYEINKFKHTIDLKKNIIEDLQKQLNKTREEGHHEIVNKEKTMNIKFNEHERKELELTYKLSQT